MEVGIVNYVFLALAIAHILLISLVERNALRVVKALKDGAFILLGFLIGSALWCLAFSWIL